MIINFKKRGVRVEMKILTDSEELGTDAYEKTSLPGVFVCPGSGCVIILGDDDKGLKIDISQAE
ncbi:MAG: hypothetical protein ACI8ZB_002578 [Desulforhopalus sp.]